MQKTYSDGKSVFEGNAGGVAHMERDVLVTEDGLSMSMY